MGEFRKVVDEKFPKLNSLDFSKMRYINSSSALMLAAEIDVWNDKIGRTLSAKHRSWHPEIKSLLCEMGFFELLGMSPLNNHQSNRHTTFLKFMSWQGAEGEKAKSLREKIEETIGRQLENRLHLFEGLTEAFTNTKQHAYDEDQDPKPFDKWWITASYKKDDQEIIVSMYDRGKTIPGTLHKYQGWDWEEIRKTLGDFIKDDSRLLEAAMRTSFEQPGKTRTRTQKVNRGRGLKQWLNFIENQGQLRIISGEGFCVFVLQDGKLSIERKRLKITRYREL